jgi:rubrerythrin
MKRIYSAQHSPEAHYVKGLLEEQGIACEVRGESLSAAQGGVPITTETAPTVWIREDEQYQEARAIIADYERLQRRTVAPGPSWMCRSCGEECEGQYAQCWNCLATRDDG